MGVELVLRGVDHNSEVVAGSLGDSAGELAGVELGDDCTVAFFMYVNNVGMIGISQGRVDGNPSGAVGTWVHRWSRLCGEVGSDTARK